MKQSFLKQLCDRHGDGGYSSKPRFIDGLVFQLCDRAEAAFGGLFIDRVESHILASNGSKERDLMLGYLITRFFRQLGKDLADVDREYAKKILSLRDLNDATFTDYFRLSADLDRVAMKAKGIGEVHKLPSLLSAYISGNSMTACNIIADYFLSKKDEKGLENLVVEVCGFAKR